MIMETNKVEIDLGLIDALVKLKEAVVIFDAHTDIISEENGKDYTDEKNDFYRGIFFSMKSIKAMLGESAMNAVCKSMPASNKDKTKNCCDRQKTNILALIEERIKNLSRSF